MVTTDHHLVKELYRKVIGEIGGIAISNSFHPYFIVNQKGTSVWQAAYVKAYVDQNREALFNNIRENNAVYTVDTAAIFTEFNLWPDRRLIYEENPLFSTYVPFIIPFLVHKSAKRIRWDQQIEQGVARQGHASDYVESINNSIRFFMPEPAFIIGFDEFDETNPSKLIDNFIKCKSMFSGH
ncbi:hypothetical protein [Fibrella forsythiae]|uniref:Uncharacterized protein n=1 Tax=Fibrella forsythiae TaxID=2817061 RepID=A0ABS3JV03_9BACT|nr:hypothetical protein [Fibrella forsythiae]MBO0953293.1 hypothetical protein [Fibrella forsythiae]